MRITRLVIYLLLDSTPFPWFMSINSVSIKNANDLFVHK